MLQGTLENFADLVAVSLDDDALALMAIDLSACTDRMELNPVTVEPVS